MTNLFVCNFKSGKVSLTAPDINVFVDADEEYVTALELKKIPKYGKTFTSIVKFKWKD